MEVEDYKTVDYKQVTREKLLSSMGFNDSDLDLISRILSLSDSSKLVRNVKIDYYIPETYKDTGCLIVRDKKKEMGF